MFDTLTIRDAKPILWLKRVFVAMVAVYVGVGLVSAHRQWTRLPPPTVRELEVEIK